MNIDALRRDGILYSSEIARLGDDPRELRVLARRGRMVRIRRGAYFPLEAWEALDERERHIVRIRAVLADRRSPAIVAGLSAAALHGMPVLGTWPDDVTLLRPHAGGGKSEPGVRQTSAGGLPSKTDVVAGIEVTTLARTAIDLARALEFPAAVATVDWALASGRMTREQLVRELATTTLRAGRARVERVIEFAADVSGSFGESMTRAVIHQLGFEAPELQREFTDAEGSMFTDFYWESVKAAAEFDGFVKFADPEYSDGDPAAALWKEKRREDRLRKQASSVTRLIWQHVMNPTLLAAELSRAGVPRRRS